ncbi:MAG: hypothetical protein V3U76_18500 [Granulosicoccus sp.]
MHYPTNNHFKNAVGSNILWLIDSLNKLKLSESDDDNQRFNAKRWERIRSLEADLCSQLSARRDVILELDSVADHSLDYQWLDEIRNASADSAIDNSLPLNGLPSTDVTSYSKAL